MTTMHSSTSTRPRQRGNPPVRLATGLLAGFVAGVVFMVLNSWFASETGGSDLAPSS